MLCSCWSKQFVKYHNDILCYILFYSTDKLLLLFQINLNTTINFGKHTSFQSITVDDKGHPFSMQTCSFSA